ncbi:uncharacterized protein LOC132753102 [Ruditapes philippinarum]|uniref:uncharacterized protein LOC132753102 n=1 Tax=Ruditapes philippinarum TaxID=129788 RepID=UPI00295B3E56|nr:uncharacterized protein LOC132753102 [Ruditapes philippinarum]XP_060599508.1 uncharacterized protein LOC132753102 [Ruditapes philippinarum]XP_060599509.1 uncharacterized protein LOC132753102 [Ruditapes philippinarum]
MAASGIAEHNEARRKERSMQKRAYQQKILMSQMAEEFGDNPDLVGAAMGSNRDTYISEVNQTRRSGSPPGQPGSSRHDAAYVDQMRREQLRQQQICEYSAKIPQRFSSIDYVSQW